VTGVLPPCSGALLCRTTARSCCWRRWSPGCSSCPPSQQRPRPWPPQQSDGRRGRSARASPCCRILQPAGATPLHSTQHLTCNFHPLLTTCLCAPTTINRQPVVPLDEQLVRVPPLQTPHRTVTCPAPKIPEPETNHALPDMRGACPSLGLQPVLRSFLEQTPLSNVLLGSWPATATPQPRQLLVTSVLSLAKASDKSGPAGQGHVRDAASNAPFRSYRVVAC